MQLGVVSCGNEVHQRLNGGSMRRESGVKFQERSTVEVEKEIQTKINRKIKNQTKILLSTYFAMLLIPQLKNRTVSLLLLAGVYWIVLLVLLHINAAW